MNLLAIPVDGAVQLAWSPIHQALGYAVYIGRSPDFSATPETFFTLAAAPPLELVIDDASPEDLYFRVAVNTGRESAPSAAIPLLPRATTDPAPAPVLADPPTLTGLASLAQGGTAARNR